MNSKSKNNKSTSAAALAVRRKILADVRSAGLQAYVEKLLVELCKVDTTPKSDPKRMGVAEERCFQIIERELAGLSFDGGRWERRPVNPAIQTHPNYSLLHFTKTADRPGGLTAEETYEGRSNLVYIAPGTNKKSAGASVALNAHVDVVAPYFPPAVRKGVVRGRGACDDKGPLVAMVAALKVLSNAVTAAGLKLNRNVVAMFVVEEETGGNGSLSLAMDRELKQYYEAVLVGEPTSLKIHPANRGAVWYRAEIKPPDGVSAFEMSAFVIEELEKEGAAIRAESRHELFPQRPVQTCHGIIGPFGEHPSRICGKVSFKIQFQRPPGKAAEALVRDCLESGLAGYIGLYGDKTKVIDPATGKPMVARHYDLRRVGNEFEVTVHGATGHMGAIRERDGAITKMAHLVRSLVISKARLSAIGEADVPECQARSLRPSQTECQNLARPHLNPLPRGEDFHAPSLSKKAAPRLVEHSEVRSSVKVLSDAAVSFELGGDFGGQNLVLEGGQGFVPTHTIEEVMERLRAAAVRGAENYLRRCGRCESGAEVVAVTFEKLHNAAFDGDPNSVAMKNAIVAAKECKIWKNEPVAGWTVSCDARLFATEYPGMPVLTFGPGELTYAHSDQEQIAVKDIVKAVEFLALFLLRQTGTL